MLSAKEASMTTRFPRIAIHLIGALAVVSATALAQTPPLATSGVVSTSTTPTAEVSTTEPVAILATPGTYVFDARPTAEFAVSHIPGALNVAQKPGTDLAEYISDAHEIDRLVGGVKTAPIVLYCNGPFCGKSKRLAVDLQGMGYSNLKRYQLGAPTWRALTSRAMVIEAEAVARVYRLDRTARFIDARPPCTSHCNGWKQVLPGSVNIQLSEVVAAKDDGRLPAEDHNTRVIVFGDSGAQAKALADSIAANAFHNAVYFDGTWEDFRAAAFPNRRDASDGDDEPR
jgi:rhodanese-related sulfurtransferase